VPRSCGLSGTYLYQGQSYRDTDWYDITGNGEVVRFQFGRSFRCGRSSSTEPTAKSAVRLPLFGLPDGGAAALPGPPGVYTPGCGWASVFSGFPVHRAQ